MAVTLHTYTKTEYKNAPDHKTTPLNATNLNNNEDGTENLYTDLAAVYSEVVDKAEQDDLTSISETGATASQAISSGTFFYLEGTLCQAKTDIAGGATFTLNTNYEVVNGGLFMPKLYMTSIVTVTVTSYGTITSIALPKGKYVAWDQNPKSNGGITPSCSLGGYFNTYPNFTLAADTTVTLSSPAGASHTWTNYRAFFLKVG